MLDHHDNQQIISWKAFLLKFITPSDRQIASSSSEVELERVRVVLSSLLATFIGAVIALVLLSEHSYWFVYVVPVLLIMASYIVGRLVNYRIGARLLIVLLATLPIIVMFAELSFDSSTHPLVLTLLGGIALMSILFSNLINRIQDTLLLMGLNAITLTAVTVLLPITVEFDAIQFSLLIVFVIISMLIGFTSYISQHERQRLAEEIHNNQLNLRQIEQLLQHSPDIIAIRADGMYRYINKKGADMLGIESVADFIDKPVADFQVKNSDDTSGHFQKALMQEETMTLRYQSDIRRMDGTTFLADVVNTLIVHDGEIANMVFARPYQHAQPQASEGLAPPIDAIQHITKPSMPSPQANDRTNERALDTTRLNSEQFAVFAKLSKQLCYILRVDDDESIHTIWQDDAFATVLGDQALPVPIDSYLAPTDAEHWRESIIALCRHSNTQVATLDDATQSQDYRIYNQTRQQYEYYRLQHTVPAQQTPSDVEAMDAIPKAQKLPRFVYGVMQDVTDEMQAQASLDQVILKQAVIAEVSTLILSTDGDPAMFGNIVLLVEQTSDAEYCAVFQYDPRLEQWERLTETQYQPQSATIYQIPDVPAFEHVRNTASTIRLGENDTAQLPAALHAQGLRFGMISPYYKGDVVSGVFVVASSQMLFDENYYFLQALSNLLNLFVKEVHQIEQNDEGNRIRQILREATVNLYAHLNVDVIIDTLHQYLALLLPSDVQATILLSDRQQNDVIVLKQVCGFGDNAQAMSQLHHKDFSQVAYLQQMQVDLQPIFQPDLSALQSRDNHLLWVYDVLDAPVIAFAAIPIHVGNNFFGAIGIYSIYPDVLSTILVNRLQTLVEKAAIALQNTYIKDNLEVQVQRRTAQLREEREQLQAIFDATGEGIVYVENNMLVFANQAMTDLIGYSLNYLTGKPLNEILVETVRSDERERLLTTYQQRYLETSSPLRAQLWRDEVTLQTIRGETVYAGFTLSPLGDQQDTNRMRAVIILHDITNQKLLAEQKTRFIANAAHELRSPVATVNTRMYLIRKNPDNLFEKHLPLLEKSVNRMNRLVTDLLDLSSFEQGKTRIKTDLLVIQDVLHEVITMEETRAESAKVNFAHDIPDDPIAIVGDADRLYQVFSNLVINAIHYTQDDGRVALRMVNHPERELVEIIVEDNGQGISPEDIDNIFVPFFRATSTKTGTGLGLSIAQEIITLHKGIISVKSELGVGSQFSVTLPTSLT